MYENNKPLIKRRKQWVCNFRAGVHGQKCEIKFKFHNRKSGCTEIY